VKKSLIFVLVFLVSIIQAQTVKIPLSNVIKERDGKQFYVHTVKQGQTVYSIAKAYNVSISEIYFENSNAKQGIAVGQKLWIPTVNKETEIKQETKNTKFDFFYHIAARNETFKHISSIYLIDERYLRLANPTLKEPLREGEYVKVPVESAFHILDGHPATETSSTNPVEQEGIDYSKNNADINSKKHKLPVTKTSQQAKTTSANTQKPVTFNPNIPVIPDYRHVVVMGETLASIAKKYHISVNELKAVNAGLVTAAQGQRLRLPVTAKIRGYHNPASQNLRKTKITTIKKEEITPNSDLEKQQPENIKNQQEFYFHKVKKKETLYSISRLYGVTLNDLYNSNRGLTKNIKIGQTIKVPKKKISHDYLIYIPPSKIRLKKLAKLYLISYTALKRRNPFIGHKVFAGQAVKIPVGPKAWIIPENNANQKLAEENSKHETFPIPLARCKKRERFHQHTYKVALMVPLYLEKTDSLDVEKFNQQQQDYFLPFRFVEFLEGALMAVDSIRSQGMHIELYVYDVDQKLTKTAEVLSKPELRNMNLIIGPFFSGSFEQVALFAQLFDIPIVNPLTFREEVVGKINNVIKIKPGITYQPELIANYILRYHHNDKVFLISQNSYKDADRIIVLQNDLISLLPATVNISNNGLINLGYQVALRNENYNKKSLVPSYVVEGKTIYPEFLKSFPDDSTRFANQLIRINYVNDSLHPFLNNASVMRNNLVLIYGDNKAFIMDVMNRLNRLTDTFNIQIVGLPEWERISNLDYKQLNNLKATYTGSYFVDYNNDTTINFIDKFINRFGTEPNKYGFDGFDISYYFFNILYNYGKNFLPCISSEHSKELTNIFHFKPSILNNAAYENSHWQLLHIENNRLTSLPDLSSDY